MSNQRICHPNGTGSTKNGLEINKKKRKRKFFQINDNGMNSFSKPTSASTEKPDDLSKSLQPAKKRRNKKKKTLEDDSAKSVKTVLVVKKPEDYSANWKNLKEIITQDDKKTSSDSPLIRGKGKFDQSMRHRKSREKHWKTSGMESTSSKVEHQEALQEEQEKLDIWFDNVDPILLEENAHNQKVENPGVVTDKKKTSSKTLVKEGSFEGVTKVVAMDCEMVGVGMNGKDSILARVSIVNQYGKILYDKFVKPTEEVVDYRTAVSGIRPADLVHACDFSVVQKEVSDLIDGRILVGHAIHNDLRTLYLSHPRSSIRDTSRYKGFLRQFGGRTPSLKKLVERFLAIQIQQGEHNSVQDAQAAMRLYTMHRREWEKSRPNKYRKRQMEKKDMTAAKKKDETSDVSRGN